MGYNIHFILESRNRNTVALLSDHPELDTSFECEWNGAGLPQIGDRIAVFAQNFLPDGISEAANELGFDSVRVDDVCWADSGEYIVTVVPYPESKTLIQPYCVNIVDKRYFPDVELCAEWHKDWPIPRIGESIHLIGILDWTDEKDWVRKVRVWLHDRESRPAEVQPFLDKLDELLDDVSELVKKKVLLDKWSEEWFYIYNQISIVTTDIVKLIKDSLYNESRVINNIRYKVEPGKVTMNIILEVV